MAKKSSEPENFWQELKRRKVIRVTTVYAAAAFVILQLVDIIAQPLQLPEWTLTLIIVLLGIGLIVTIIVSWIYDITPAGVRKTNPASATKHSNQTSAPTSSGWKIATYVSAVIIVGLISFNFISRRNLHADTKLEKSIAVLPFRNDTPVDSNKHFIDGIMEEVLLNLQTLNDLRVLSRTSVELYRNTTKSIPEIARELGVNYIVEGSGQKSGKNFRLRVQLIRAKGKETHMWANSYEQEIKDTKVIFNIQSQIAQSIAGELKTIITPEEKQLIERTPTASITAHNFYLRGNYEQSKYSDRDSSTRTALDRADRLYKKALENDPSYAQAYVGMALVYWNKYYWETFISENFLDSVLILTNKALSIDGQLSEAHRLKGNYYRQIGDYEQAIKELSKAIEFNPNDGEAFYRRAEILYFNNSDYAKSLEDFQIAISLVPESLLPDLYRDLCWEYLLLGFVEKANYYCEQAFTLDRDSLIYYFYLSGFEYGQGNFVKADEFLLKAYEIDSSNTSIIFRLGENCMFLGQYEESLKYFKEWLKHTKSLSDNYLFNIYRVGWAYWQNGFKKEAKVYFDKQIEYINRIMEMRHSYQNERPSYNLAAAFAFMGDRKKAYENLREWAKNPFCSLWSLTFLRHDPFFNSIRSEAEFQKIVSDQEAKYNAEHERVKKWLEEQGML